MACSECAEQITLVQELAQEVMALKKARTALVTINRTFSKDLQTVQAKADGYFQLLCELVEPVEAEEDAGVCC